MVVRDHVSVQKSGNRIATLIFCLLLKYTNNTIGYISVLIDISSLSGFLTWQVEGVYSVSVTMQYHCALIQEIAFFSML